MVHPVRVGTKDHLDRKESLEKLDLRELWVYLEALVQSV